MSTTFGARCGYDRMVSTLHYRHVCLDLVVMLTKLLLAWLGYEQQADLMPATDHASDGGNYQGTACY